MQDDFLAEAKAIARAMDIKRSDMLERRLAEQEMRALGMRVVGHGLQASLASLFRRLKAAWPTRQGEIARAKPVSLHDWLL